MKPETGTFAIKAVRAAIEDRKRRLREVEKFERGSLEWMAARCRVPDHGGDPGPSGQRQGGLRQAQRLAGHPSREPVELTAAARRRACMRLRNLLASASPSRLMVSDERDSAASASLCQPQAEDSLRRTEIFWRLFFVKEKTRHEQQESPRT